MIILRPWTAPRCPRCGRRPICVELIDEDTRSPLGVYCQGCGIEELHQRNDELAQQARASRWTKPDRRGV